MSQQVCFNHAKYAGALTLDLPASEAMRNKFLLLIATQFYAFCYCWPNCVDWVLFSWEGFPQVIASFLLLASVSTK